MKEDTDQLIANAAQMLRDADGIEDALLAPNAATLADAATYLHQKRADVAGLQDLQRRYLKLACGFAHAQGDHTACAGFHTRLAQTHAPETPDHRRALHEAANALLRAGRSADALAVLRKAAELASKAGDTRFLYSLWNNMARPLAETGRPDQALELLQLVLARSGDDKMRAAAAVNATLACAMLGRLAEATGFAEQGIALYEAIGDKSSTLKARQALVQVLIQSGELSRAASELRWLAREAEVLGDRATLGIAMGSLGGVLIEMGDLHEGRLAIEQACDVFSALGDHHSLANSCINLGVALIEEGLPGESIRHLEHAVAQFEHLGDETYRANARVDLAEAFVLAGKLPEAAATLKLEQASADSPEIGLRCFWHAVSAALDEAQGRIDAARAHYAEVLRLAADNRMNTEVAKGALAAARLELGQGRYMQALDLSGRAAEALRGAGQTPLMLVEALSVGARTAQKLGDRVAMKTRLIRALELADELPLLAKSEGPRAQALVAELRELQANM